MTRNLKLFTIFCLLLLFCLGYTKTVKANTHPTMSINQAEMLLNIMKQKTSYNELGAYSTNMTINEIHTMLETIQPTILSNDFNTKASGLTYDFEWEDVTVFYGYGIPGNASKGLSIYYVIAPNNYENFTLNQNNTTRTNFVLSTNYKNISTSFFMQDYSIASSTPAQNINIWPKYSTIVTDNNNMTITNLNNLIINIKEDRHIKYNNYDYTLPYDIVYFTDSGGTGNEPIEGDTESSFGYYFYDGIENVKQINKLGLENYQNLNEWWYIGNDLTFNYDYYYLNNNEKVSVKNYVDIVQTNNSGDTGKFYIPRIDRQQLNNLPNETGFYLDLTINSGDIVLANQFYSFVTYSSVVDSGATGTITNTSGDVTGNIDLTGIQSALTNEVSFENVSVNSGDVLNSLGFEFETDPYANFWTNLTIGLYSALTSSVRSIDITFRDRTYTINLDNYTTQEPSVLKVFFATISSTFVVMMLIKWIKITIDEVTSGDVDTLLQSNKEERHYKFVLGGV